MCILISNYLIMERKALVYVSFTKYNNFSLPHNSLHHDIDVSRSPPILCPRDR